MMTRTHMNDEEKEAMHILDLVKAGEDVPDSVILWALRTCGDAIGLK
jgi:hypothetical protein